MHFYFLLTSCLSSCFTFDRCSNVVSLIGVTDTAYDLTSRLEHSAPDALLIIHKHK